jgi:hypothetical protein
MMRYRAGLGAREKLLTEGTKHKLHKKEYRNQGRMPTLQKYLGEQQQYMSVRAPYHHETQGPLSLGQHISRRPRQKRNRRHSTSK